MTSNGGKRSKISKLSQLLPDARNANLGTERGNALIERSLRDYGAGRSILIDREGRIIAGNKTVENAAAIGLDEVQVVQTDGTKIIAVQRMDLDMAKDPRARAMALADNRSSELNLEWAGDVLAEMGKDIDLQPFFSARELAAILGRGDEFSEVPEPKIDQAEELRKKWQVKTGQLWAIKGPHAPHRLLCGDCTQKADVTRLWGSERAAMAFTDPPWNVAIGQDSNPRHRQRAGLQNDALSADDFAGFLRAFAEQMTAVVDGDVYCILGASEWPTLDRELRACGYHWSATIIWVKDLFVLGRSKYHRRYEPLWYGWHKKSHSSYCAARDEDDVWEIPRPRISEEHPTMKPVALPRKAIRNSSEAGGLIYEPFAGGGSTICAAEQVERGCYAIEIEPKYVAVCLERVSEMGMRAEMVK